MKRKLLISAALILLALASSAQDQLPKLKKSVTYEKMLVNDAGLAVIGRISPVRSSLDRPSLWSIGSETLDRDFAKFDNYKQYIGETGVGYARIQSGWDRTEKVKGQYEWEWLDHIVDGLLEQGVRPWMCLCYGSSAYMKDIRDVRAFANDKEVMKAWTNYVKAVVKRYKGKVNLWEVWNESDLRQRKYPDEYAILFVETAKAVKSVDKDAKVAIFALSDLDKPYVEPVLDKVKELGGCKYLDYATYHAYFDNPDMARELALRFCETVHKYNPDTGILQGETGCPAQLEYAHALSNREWTETSQAKWDARQMLTQFSIGVPSSVFTMVDLNYGNMIQSFGLIRMNLQSVPQYKRPKFYAVQNITSVITADCKANEVPRITRSSTAREITIVGMEKAGKTVGCFLWYGGNVPAGTLERDKVNLTIEGIAFEDPVLVDLLTGKIHSLSACRERGSILGDRIRLVNLPVWDAPVLIVNKAEIAIAKP